MMTKRWIALFLAALMALTISACGQGVTAGAESGSVSIGAESSIEVSKTDEEKEEGTLLSRTYKVPGREVYVDVPNYPEYSDGFTETFAVYGSRYIAFTHGKRIQAADAKDAQAKVWELFAPAMESYGGGVNNIDIQKDELLTVNGMEVDSFEGMISYGSNPVYDGYAKGYSFIVDGMPCHIIGSVYSEEQTQDEIDEIRAIVDAMIYTVRTEP